MRSDDVNAADGAEPRVSATASTRGAAQRGEDVVRVGVISDTHGQLSDEIPELFAGVDRIVHAGDVGDERVLQRLALVAPVTAVHGNMDAGLPAADLPLEAVLDVGRVRLLVGHVKEALLRRHNPAREGVAVVDHGTHAPRPHREGPWRPLPEPRDCQPRAVGSDGRRAWLCSRSTAGRSQPRS